MSLPPLAPIPPASVRSTLDPAEWEACLDAWIQLLEITLHSSPKRNGSDNGSNEPFLRTYYHEVAYAGPNDDTLRNPKAQSLQKGCSKLLQRLLHQTGSLTLLSDWGFLADISRVYLKSAAFQTIFANVWQQRNGELKPMLQNRKEVMTKGLENASMVETEPMLAQLIPMMRCSSDVATYFVTGSDFLDALTSAYAKTEQVHMRKTMVTTAYTGLTSCVATPVPNVSQLSDHLYSLKEQADSLPPTQSLLADLVTNTPFLAKLRRTVSGKGQERLLKLLDTLETYRLPSIAQPRRRIRQRTDKGKGKQKQSDTGFHVHQMSLVSQVQDLFPDLGSGFILRLLEEYGEDVELVTAHLLDDSLPPHLQSLDRSEQASLGDTDPQHQIDHLNPPSTEPAMEPYIPERRNVFDDDELDRLEFDTANLHIGKKEHDPSSNSTSKAAILSALAAFDSDDDERDDTYDVEDVGGTVDTAHPDGEPGTTAKMTLEENEMALFNAYKSSPALFGRTFDVRRGQARAALKAETGMTDEQIEGWAIMLQRDPRRVHKLEAQAAGSFDGRQTELGRSSYREPVGGTETEDSDAGGPLGGRGGRGGGRGRGGRGGRGRGGSVAGPSGEAGTANAQRRKEASKGSRANHNRRDQRAKKMARGGFPG